MKAILISLFSVLMASRGYCEVSYEMHTGYSSKIEIRGTSSGSWTCGAVYRKFPILISLEDESGVSISNAIIVLKRIGPNGWTEEELKREKDSMTDKNGMIVVMYPSATVTENKSGQECVSIYGAVTVIAEGHRTVTIELRDYFKDGICILSSDSAPHLKLSLKNDRPPEDGMKRGAEQSSDGKTPEAEQDGGGQPATRPLSK